MKQIDANRLKTALARRAFLKTGSGLGALALAELLGGTRLLGQTPSPSGGVVIKRNGVLKELHFAPRAKRVIRINMIDAV